MMDNLRPRGERFLHAAQKGDMVTLQNLTTDSCDCERQCCVLFQYKHSKSGDQAVHIAARHGHLNVLSYLGKQGVDLETVNLEGKQALHEAAASGWMECVAYLLGQGVDVDPLKRADWTPLHLACTKPNLCVIEMLIEHGAKPELRNKDGWNAFHIASREGHTNILEFLLNCTNVMWNTVSKNGRTPLHTIALHGRIEACKLVLSKCCYKTDVADSCGSTPLMDALRAGFTNVADVLIQEHKADVLKEDVLGRMPLHVAAQAGREDSVNFLVSCHNVPVDIGTKQHGLTAIHLAAKEGHGQVISALIKLHSNINHQDNKGRTALYIAASSDKLDCVQILVNCGALQVVDKSGNTPRNVTSNLKIRQLLNESM